MDLDPTQVASAVVPFIATAVHAYGTRTLERIRDDTVDRASNAAVELGRKVLARLFNGEQARPAIKGAVIDLEAAHEQESATRALHLQIANALAAEPKLLNDIADIIDAARCGAPSIAEATIQISQNASSFDSSKQAIMGSGTQNVTFGNNEPRS